MEQGRAGQGRGSAVQCSAVPVVPLPPPIRYSVYFFFFGRVAEKIVEVIAQSDV